MFGSNEGTMEMNRKRLGKGRTANHDEQMVGTEIGAVDGKDDDGNTVAGLVIWLMGIGLEGHKDGKGRSLL